ncbi:MAG TPA: hypothetical protein VGG68_07700 [Caulobacteraceae bacterium]|jgi:hypothetical protein
MPTFNIEDAAFAGVGLLGRRPMAALIWAVLWAILIALVTIPFVGILANFLTLFVRFHGEPDPSLIAQQFPGIFAFIILAGLCSLVLGAVISCAVYRAVLTPENSAFAYLRMGEQEIQVLIVNFVKALTIGAASFGMAMVLVAVEVASSSGHMGGPLDLVGRLIIQCVVFWLQLRLSMAGPMTFAERRFRLFESWTLTRGIVLRLLAVGVILFFIGLVVYLALATLGIAAGLAIWNSAPRPADLQLLLSQSPNEWMGPLAPFIALSVMLVIIGGSVLTPIIIAPWAYIYREHALSSEGAAATFA